MQLHGNDDSVEAVDATGDVDDTHDDGDDDRVKYDITIGRNASIRAGLNQFHQLFVCLPLARLYVCVRYIG